MKFVVLDTNILVSALWSKEGKPAIIIEQMFERVIKPCFNEKVIAEYVDVLYRDKFPFVENETNDIINFIKEKGAYITGEPKETDISKDIHFPDEDDRAFYDVAKLCGAVLITGNKRHYPQDPDIVTPAEFLGIGTGEMEVNEAFVPYHRAMLSSELQACESLLAAKDAEIAALLSELQKSKARLNDPNTKYYSAEEVFAGIEQKLKERGL
ncbi:MAG: putative toxin-antitoxin system toxin component, PIN family [Oscillospiraceae bacterium]|nr:putative toxin-antitoxin system toxin component, PIN family [Oscillospiraceae bacterium]